MSFAISFAPWIFHFSTFHESVTDRPTDGRTDRRTDRRTDTPSYRDAIAASKNVYYSFKTVNFSLNNITGGSKLLVMRFPMHIIPINQYFSGKDGMFYTVTKIGHIFLKTAWMHLNSFENCPVKRNLILRIEWQAVLRDSRDSISWARQSIQRIKTVINKRACRHKIGPVGIKQKGL